MLVTCPECGAKISSGAVICPSCGKYRAGMEALERKYKKESEEYRKTHQKEIKEEERKKCEEERMRRREEGMEKRIKVLVLLCFGVLGLIAFLIYKLVFFFQSIF